MALQEHGAGLTHPVALSKGLICLGQLGPTSAVPLLHFSSAFPSEHCVMGLFPKRRLAALWGDRSFAGCRDYTAAGWIPSAGR